MATLTVRGYSWWFHLVLLPIVVSGATCIVILGVPDPLSVPFWTAVQAVSSSLAFFVALSLAWTALRQIKATEDQLRVTADQLEVMRGSQQSSDLARWQDNKPIVILDRRDNPDIGPGNAHWVISNIGRGLAVNVFEFNSVTGKTRSLGGLAAGTERPVTHELAEELGSQDEARHRHILIAEGVATRTRRWNPTLNLLRADATFVHLLAYPPGEGDEGLSAQDEEHIVVYIARNSLKLDQLFRLIAPDSSVSI